MKKEHLTEESRKKLNEEARILSEQISLLAPRSAQVVNQLGMIIGNRIIDEDPSRIIVEIDWKGKRNTQNIGFMISDLKALIREIGRERKKRYRFGVDLNAFLPNEIHICLS